MNADAAHLAMLANDLKASLDRAGNSGLSADALQKVVEIEKLAKHLKEQMRNP
jgi:hypothetical protein